MLQTGIQTLTANFTPSDAKDYSATTASTTITVTSAAPIITWPQPANVTAGTALSAAQLDATANVPGTFTYTPPAGTVLQSGTQTLTVNFTPNDAKDYSSATASTTITVTPNTPVITWPQPGNITAGTALSAAQLDATANVPGTFAYNPPAGTVLPAGTQTLTANFTPTDAKDYSSATASTTITVTSNTPVISWPQPANVTAGTALSSAQLDATANVPGTFTYTPPAGTVLQAGAQTLTVNFTPDDSKDYSSTTASRTITVTSATPVITWPQPANVTAGTALSSAQLDAAANVPGTFTYTPPAGTVLKAGAQTLTANFTPTDTKDYSSATASTIITVVNSTTPLITWQQPANVTAGTPLSSAQLNATANVPGTFTYTPPAGTVLQAGTQTLTANFTPTDAKDYSSTSASTTITVTPNTPVITWPQPANATAGTALSSAQLNATANVPGTFTYTPPAGTVLQAGTQTLTANFTPTDAKDYSSASASTTITVTSTTPVITWPQPANITAGTALSSAQLDATANVPGTFTYTPPAGTVLQTGIQTLTAHFTPDDAKDYSSTSASTTITVASTTPVITWPQPANVTAGTALSSAQLNATANVPGTFTYTPPAGTVLQTGTQTLTVNFTPTDTKDYSSTSASTTITVTSTTPVITWPQPANVTAGTALSSAQLNATANVPGTFTYTPPAGTVLQAGTQTLTVNFTPTDTKDYSSTSASTTITVTSTTPVITWPQPATITAGTALSSAQLNATTNVPGTFTYNPAAGTVLPVGPQTLTVSFTPSDAKDYSSASASTTLTVTSGVSGRGTTYNVNSSMSESTIQSTVNTACGSSGNTVAFAAGNYTGWTKTLNVPAANGCVITGAPNASIPFVGTTILNIDGGIGYNNQIMALNGCSGSAPGAAATIEYLTFDNAPGIYKPGACSGYEITHNEFENLNPAPGSAYQPSILGDGAGSDISTGWDISWNHFHDNCAQIDQVMSDEGGYCTATYDNGTDTYSTWENNTVNGQEEGYKTPPSAAYIAHMTITGNQFINIHRIAIETQYAVSTSSWTVGNNVSQNYFGPPLLPCFFTFANSIPMYGSSSPAFTSDDNLVIAGQPVACPNYGSGAHYGIAMEIWGSGLTVQNNLIEGGPVQASGYAVFSLGAGSGSTVTNNIACGYDANQAGAVGLDTSAGTQTGYTDTPNTWSLTCPVIIIPTPTVSPASGSYGSPPTITLSDSRANTTIYYTTDGSTPTVASTVYTGPFVAPALPITIKAIAQWGTGANIGVSFPSGYGYTPSSVQSASYTTAPSPAAKPASGSQDKSSATRAATMAAIASTAGPAGTQSTGASTTGAGGVDRGTGRHSDHRQFHNWSRRIVAVGSHRDILQPDNN